TDAEKRGVHRGSVGEGSDRRHWQYAGGVDGHDADVAVEIEIEYLADIGFLSAAGKKDIHLDGFQTVAFFAGRAVRPEDVPAGQDRRAADAAIDDRSRAEVGPGVVGDANPHAGRQRFPRSFRVR